MGNKSKIEWTDVTWNPTTGCSKVSAGCTNCYAKRNWNRLQHLLPAYKGRAFEDVRCHPERLINPLCWQSPRLVFVNSMSDLFHEDIPGTFIDAVFAAMALSPQHTFQVLTKRPEKMKQYFMSDCWGVAVEHRWFAAAGVYKLFKSEKEMDFLLKKTPQLPNVWLGVSVEDQEAADERIPLLLDTPAAVRFISAEPLLGRINLSSRVLPNDFGYADVAANWLRGMTIDAETGEDLADTPGNKIDWVICGGEFGPKARPTDPRWVRSLRDQCLSNDVPFFFQEWGEWGPDCIIPVPDAYRHRIENGERAAVNSYRLGRQRTGRLLDGELWDEYPKCTDRG